MFRRTAVLSILALLSAALTLLPASAQGAPPQVQRALDLLGQYLSRTVTLADMDIWFYSQAFYTDTSLGCSLITTPTSFATPASGYTVELVYQGVRYEFRVREDLTDAFPCDAALLATAGGAPVITATAPAPETNCPPGFAGYLRPRLVVGGQARLGEGGTPNRLRALPSVNAEQIGLIQPGTTVQVLSGPSCEDASRIIWWRVDAAGTIGWTAEGRGEDYFIAPVAGGPLSLPTGRVVITAPLLNSLISLATIAYPGASSLSFSAGGLMAVGGEGGLLVYDLNTLQQLALQLPIQPVVAQVAFSPDGHYLAFATTDDALYIVDTQTGVTITPADAPATDIQALAFSSTGLLAVGGGSPLGDPSVTNTWYIYDIPNQRQLGARPTTSYVRDVAFSPDGALFAWYDTALNIVNVGDGATVLSQPIAQPGFGGLAWRPTPIAGVPLQIAYADGTNIRLLSLGGQAQSFGEAPAFFPGVVGFSPDAALLAAMNLQPDGEPVPSVLSIFDAATPGILYGSGYDLGVDFGFSPDGTLLVLVTADQVVFLGLNPEVVAVG
ncbi:MAG: SH3 domain-containing protein [Anaerolineae bacterium]|nr:SH3 domain-containing protein [Anaerolineae bacterium]NUQ06986.1 SH3 domain-containing protein [Anaerolineae bacterium]